MVVFLDHLIRFILSILIFVFFSEPTNVVDQTIETKLILFRRSLMAIKLEQKPRTLIILKLHLASNRQVKSRVILQAILHTYITKTNYPSMIQSPADMTSECCVILHNCHLKNSACFLAVSVTRMYVNILTSNAPWQWSVPSCVFVLCSGPKGWNIMVAPHGR